MRSEGLNKSAETSWSDSLGKVHSGNSCGRRGGFDVIECACCRFKHVVPLPSASELLETYSHEYYSVEKPLYIERYLEDKDWWELVYRMRFETFEQLLGSAPRSVLDIGSGPGLFLEVGRRRGWRVKGVEPSRQAAAYSRDTLGLDVSQMFLDASSARGLGSFAAINMSLVLEHVPDPAEMLSTAHGLLEDGGVICIVAPNDFNPFQLCLRDHAGFNPWWIAPPHHLNYFDFASLGGLLERTGYSVVHRESTFPIDLFLLMGQDYVGNDGIGRDCHRMRKRFEMSFAKVAGGDALRDLYARLSGAGVGREAVIFARKL